jgi:diguanylate cyclase (GGDEF)-like protein
VNKAAGMAPSHLPFFNRNRLREFHMRHRFDSWLASFDRKTQIRLQSTLFAAVDYVINVLVLFAFAFAGSVAWRVPFAVLLLGVAVNAMFIGAIASGATQQLRDPSLTGAQVFAACAINLTGLALAPHLVYLFVLNLFVPLSYSTLHFGRRTFFVTWLLLSAALGLIMLAVGMQREAAIVLAPSTTESALFWVVVVITFGRFLAINADVSELRARLKSRNEELAEVSSRMGDLASRDQMTGLWNRREFMRLLQDESRRAVRNKTGFCVAVIGVDRYADVQGRFGDGAAASLMHDVAQSLEISRRAADSLARHGETEFAMLLPGAKLSTATVALERTRGQLLLQPGSGSQASGLDDDAQYSISAGVAAWQPGELLADVLGRAEEALGQARQSGQRSVRAARASA